MASVTADQTESSAAPGAGDSALVDPRAPRFGQAITATVLVVGIALAEPLAVAAVAVVLNVAVLSGWRYDLYAFLWRSVMVPLVGAPSEREPAAPHRFAKLVGATFTAVATLFLALDVVVGGPAVALGLSAAALAGYALAALVAALAGAAATTGLCVGCRMYRQVAFFRRLDVI